MDNKKSEIMKADDTSEQPSGHIVELLVQDVLHIFERITGKKISNIQKQSFAQFVKFCFVGLSNTLVSYVLYSLSLLIFRRLQILRGYDYLVAQIIQFILSVLWSFYWNNQYVFKLGKDEKRSFWKSLVKTYISYSFTGLFLSSILLIFWIKCLHVSEFVAPILNLLISVPLNFLINKYWAFKSSYKQ